VFNQYGNRKNKNTARFKFVLRGRGIEWLREQIEKEYADILANGGIVWPEIVPEGFGGYESNPQPLGNGSLLPVLNHSTSPDPAYDAWLETNVTPQKQTGYAAVTARVDQGNVSASQWRGLGKIAQTAGDGLVRTTINQNLLLAYVPLSRLPQVYAALKEIDLGGAGANQIEDVLTCPGAYTCNLGITKTMNLGAALQDAVRSYDDPQVRRLTIKASGCPNACGRQCPEAGRPRASLLPDAAGRRLRSGRHHALRPGHPEPSRARCSRSVDPRDRPLPGQSRERRKLPQLRDAPQGGDLPRPHRRSRQAG
jgi:sulfite reductase beta subunit-like hemoprotein